MRYLFAVIFAAISFLSFAQQPAKKEKAQNVYFYKKGYVEVSTKDSADIIQIVTEPDPGETLYDVQEFYKDGGSLLVGKSADIHPIKLQGQAVYYYPNRSKRLVANYIIGTPSGDSYEYYPDGKIHMVMNYSFRDSIDKIHRKVLYRDSLFKYLYDPTGKVLVDNGNGHFVRYAENNNTIVEEGNVKNGHATGEWHGTYLPLGLSFSELYNDGKLVKGMSVDNLGGKYIYYSRVKVADYLPYLKTRIIEVIHEGNMSLLAKVNILGRVNIRMTISADGTPENYTILQSVNRDVDAEALRRIKLAKKWQPAEYYGKKAASNYSTTFLFVAPK